MRFCYRNEKMQIWNFLKKVLQLKSHHNTLSYDGYSKSKSAVNCTMEDNCVLIKDNESKQNVNNVNVIVGHLVRQHH